MRKYSIILLLMIIMICFIFLPEIEAQCPMCRMSAESNLEHGGTMGKGLNKGILYMLSLPYLLVATIGFIWYKNRNNINEANPERDN